MISPGFVGWIWSDSKTFMLGFTVEAIVYGIFLVLMGFFVASFRRKKLSKASTLEHTETPPDSQHPPGFRKLAEPRVIMLAISYLLFVVSTTRLALDAAILMRLLYALIKNTVPGVAMEDDSILRDTWYFLSMFHNPSTGARDGVSTYKAIPLTLSCFSIFCSDVVVVWRALALHKYGANRRSRASTWAIAALLCCLLTATFSAMIVFLVSTFRVNSVNWFSEWPFQFAASEAWIIASLATNLSATVIIWWQVRIRSKLIASTRSSHTDTSNIATTGGNKLLYLLVESGTVYCTFQLAQLVLNLCLTVPMLSPRLKAPGAISSSLENSCLMVVASIAGLYPTLMFTLIGMHRNMTSLYPVASPSFSNTPIIAPSTQHDSTISVNVSGRSDVESAGISRIKPALDLCLVIGPQDVELGAQIVHP